MTTTIPQADYDARWKHLIKALHRQFVKRFFPLLYDLIDWTKEVQFLDKELLKLLADFNKKGVLHGDVLMQYHLKDGKTQLVLIHVEAQHIFDIKLPERMFTSFYRLRDQHPGVPVAALALYTGSEIPAVFDRYVYEFEETRLEYRFKTYIVKNQNPEALLQTGDPIDLAILAAWYLLDSKNDLDKAIRYKRTLIKLCVQKGFSKQEIAVLLTFVSFLIAIPHQEDKILKEEIMETLADRELPLYVELPWLAEFLAERFMIKEAVDIYARQKGEEIALERVEAKVRKEMEAKARERNVKSVIKQHLLGMKPQVIADVQDVDLKFVQAVIRQHKAAQKKAKLNPPTQN